MPLLVGGGLVLLLAVVFALSGVGAGVGQSWLEGWPSDAPPEVLMADAVPTVSEDPVVQDQFEGAWRAFRDADLDEALRKLDVVREREPEQPLPHLFAGVAATLHGDTTAGLEATREAHRLTRDSEGPAAELAHALVRTQQSGSLSERYLPDYAEAHPDDYLGQLVVATWCYGHGAEFCEQAHARLLALDPAAPIAHHSIAESWSVLGRWDEVQRTAEAGLQVSPNDPTLLSLIARSHLASGDLVGGRAALQRTIEADHRRTEPKLLLARVALVEDDSATFDGLRDELLAATVPTETRVLFLTETAGTLVGLGRLREAEARYAEAEELERASGTPLGALNVRMARKGAAASAARWDEVLEHTDAVDELCARNPEIPNSIRDRMAAYRVHTEGLVAVRRGDVAEAERQLGKLESAEFVPPTAQESLAREIAIARGDAGAVAKLDQQLFGSPCSQAATMGGALLRVGDLDGARARFTSAVEGGCALHTSERASLVAAHVGLAEIAKGRGEGYAQHVGAVEDLWPAADADHPFVARIAALAE